ncbi:PCC domain-containing protein [Martelella soudanensis]|uniref:PCC domain-containing protein n=2 Tax=unclassified Martelella TaxID=2629616 RepID=UPI001FEF172A|nr:DUF296 domain-containing protein [Martelella sp. NC20]
MTRFIKHPGPVSAERYRAVACRAEPLRLRLEAGTLINGAVAKAFAGAGFRAGWAALEDVRMDRMNYVMPAASPDDNHAAWYSATFSPEPGGLIRTAGLHLGIRDGEPFLHCHGTWEVPSARREFAVGKDPSPSSPQEGGLNRAANVSNDQDGEAAARILPPLVGERLAFDKSSGGRGGSATADIDTSVSHCMGHLLPFEATLAEPAEIDAWGVSGAALVVRDDAETNFRIFSAEASDPALSNASHPAILATVRPNIDICEAIEAICTEHGLTEARVFGIGSLVGVTYQDGRDVPDYATEILIRDGSVRVEDGRATCRLDIDMVGMSGAITSGLLRRGENPVCVTFELQIVGA